MDEQWQRTLLTSIQELRSSAVLCDVFIMCKDNVHMKAHSLILAAASGYFLRAFTRQNVPHAAYKVRVPFAADILTEALNFVYTGRVICKDKEVLLKFAQYLEMKCLKDVLEGVGDFQKNIAVQTALELKDESCQVDEERIESEPSAYTKRTVYTLNSVDNNEVDLKMEHKWVADAQQSPPSSVVSKILKQTARIEVEDVTVEEILTAVAQKGSELQLPQHITNPSSSLFKAHRSRKKKRPPNRRRQSARPPETPVASTSSALSAPPTISPRVSTSTHKMPRNGKKRMKNYIGSLGSLDRLRMKFQKKLGSYGIAKNGKATIAASKLKGRSRKRREASRKSDPEEGYTHIIISGSSGGVGQEASSESSHHSEEPKSFNHKQDVPNISSISTHLHRELSLQEKTKQTRTELTPKQTAVSRSLIPRTTVSQPTVEKTAVTKSTACQLTAEQTALTHTEHPTNKLTATTKSPASQPLVLQSTHSTSDTCSQSAKCPESESNNNCLNKSSLPSEESDNLPFCPSERESLLALYVDSDSEDEFTDKETDPTSPISDRQIEFNAPFPEDFETSPETLTMPVVLGTPEFISDIHPTDEPSSDKGNLLISPNPVNELKEKFTKPVVLGTLEFISDIHPTGSNESNALEPRQPGRRTKRSHSNLERWHSPRTLNGAKRRRNSTSNTGSREVQFVGRNIFHAWIDDDGSFVWYRGHVLRVTRGFDGDRGTEYEVKYDDLDDSYGEYTNFVDHLLEDYLEDYLVFI